MRIILSLSAFMFLLSACNGKLSTLQKGCQAAKQAINICSQTYEQAQTIAPADVTVSSYEEVPTINMLWTARLLH
ncbi:MAG: hypothetical protein ACK4HE_08680 [Chitinophagaceae bacterium]|jgi:hypothetical protein